MRCVVFCVTRDSQLHSLSVRLPDRGRLKFPQRKPLRNESDRRVAWAWKLPRFWRYFPSSLQTRQILLEWPTTSYGVETLIRHRRRSFLLLPSNETYSDWTRYVLVTAEGNENMPRGNVATSCMCNICCFRLLQSTTTGFMGVAT